MEGNNSGIRKPGLRFDRPVEFANFPFSNTAGRLLTIRGHGLSKASLQ
jgi:hypothetical protein